MTRIEDQEEASFRAILAQFSRGNAEQEDSGSKNVPESLGAWGVGPGPEWLVAVLWALPSPPEDLWWMERRLWEESRYRLRVGAGCTPYLTVPRAKSRVVGEFH